MKSYFADETPAVLCGHVGQLDAGESAGVADGINTVVDVRTPSTSAGMNEHVEGRVIRSLAAVQSESTIQAAGVFYDRSYSNSVKLIDVITITLFGMVRGGLIMGSDLSAIASVCWCCLFATRKHKELFLKMAAIRRRWDRFQQAVDERARTINAAALSDGDEDDNGRQSNTSHSEQDIFVSSPAVSAGVNQAEQGSASIQWEQGILPSFVQHALMLRVNAANSMQGGAHGPSDLSDSDFD